jgi:hypothetical protein
MTLDAKSVAVGVTVGVAMSVCVALALRWAGPSEDPAARRRNSAAPPPRARRESVVEAAHAGAIGPRGKRERSGSIPVPLMDMTSLMGVVLRPPLDERVATMLESTSLCYLSTFSLDEGEPAPHISLMRFTYVRGEEVVLVSTNRRTKKFAQMCASPSVAVLVHDFADVGRIPDVSGQRAPAVALESPAAADNLLQRGSLSITLNGTVRAQRRRRGRSMSPCARYALHAHRAG